MTAILRNEIDLGEAISRGGYGVVRKAKYKGRDVAVKVIKENIEGKNMQREPLFMMMVNNHPNFVKLYGVVMQKNETFLVMEYISGGSLFHFLHNTREDLKFPNAINLLLQAAEALVYLLSISECSVIHRDVKSHNMLIDNERKNLKICDFGAVRVMQQEMTNKTGTLLYIAPEVFNGANYTDKCDVYSMGITIWEVLARKIPYQDIKKGPSNAFMKQIEDGLRPSLNELIFDCSKELKDFISKCWDKDPKVRPTMQEVANELRKYL